MIKKRTRPNVRVREISPDPPPTTSQSTAEPNTFFEPGAEDIVTALEEEDKLSYVSSLPLFLCTCLLRCMRRALLADENALGASFRVAELVELRKLRKAREGIDVTRLNKPETKKKKKKKVEEGEGEEEQYGLRMGTGKGRDEDDDDE